LGIGIWLYVDQNILKVVDFVVEDQSSLFRAASILLIALGAFVLLVSVLGFVGACIEHPTVLTIVSSLWRQTIGVTAAGTGLQVMPTGPDQGRGEAWGLKPLL